MSASGAASDSVSGSGSAESETGSRSGSGSGSASASGSAWSWRELVAPVVPATRLASLRILVGLYGSIYLAVRLPHLFSYALDDLDRWRPVGLATLASAPTLPVVYQVLVVLTLALSLLFLLGWRFRKVAPIYAAVLLWTLTYSNCWGKILHTDNLLVWHVIALAFAPAADALSLDARAGRRRAGEASRDYGWAIQLMAALTVSIYLLAGIAKLRNSGFGFVDGETLRNFVAFGNVRKIELGSHHSPIGAWASAYPAFFSVLAWGSLALELGAPLALLHRRVGRLWSYGVWGFHLGVLVLMAIGFMYQMTFIAFAPFFRCERLVLRVRDRVRSRRVART